LWDNNTRRQKPRRPRAMRRESEEQKKLPVAPDRGAEAGPPLRSVLSRRQRQKLWGTVSRKQAPEHQTLQWTQRPAEVRACRLKPRLQSWHPRLQWTQRPAEFANLGLYKMTTTGYTTNGGGHLAGYTMTNTNMTNDAGVVDSVKEYYSKHLKTSDDLLTNACCTGAAPPDHIKAALKKIHPEVIAKYYGCGLCLPDHIEGLSVLDLGCGAGRDVYIASQLVGPQGRVVGVDMTPEQLDVANAHKAYHAEKCGLANVEFKLGFIERLGELGLPDSSFDVI
ncbi:unnamed protein product, partial [Polarella glacialis]